MKSIPGRVVVDGREALNTRVGAGIVLVSPLSDIANLLPLALAAMTPSENIKLREESASPISTRSTAHTSSRDFVSSTKSRIRSRAP